MFQLIPSRKVDTSDSTIQVFLIFVSWVAPGITLSVEVFIIFAIALTSSRLVFVSFSPSKINVGIFIFYWK